MARNSHGSGGPTTSILCIFMSFRSVSAFTPCRSVIIFSKLPWRHAREGSRCASRLRRWRRPLDVGVGVGVTVGIDCGSGTRRRSTGRSRTASNYQICLVPSLIWFFFIGDKKRGTRHRGDLHFGRTCNDCLVTDFREILRINARAGIDSSRGKNIRDPASMTAQRHTDDGVVGASFLSKSCDLKEAIFRDRDCEL